MPIRTVRLAWQILTLFAIMGFRLLSASIQVQLDVTVIDTIYLGLLLTRPMVKLTAFVSSLIRCHCLLLLSRRLTQF